MDHKVSLGAQLREYVRENMRVILFLGLILLLLQDVFGTHGVLAMRRSQKEAAAIQKEIKQLNDENRQLQDCVKDLKSDPATIEGIAREDMGLARPGEYVFKLPAKPADAANPVSSAAAPGTSRQPAAIDAPLPPCRAR
ncbi:MAG: septum formation initiator family protein [Candidatus Acidiferrales bacterium]